MISITRNNHADLIMRLFIHVIFPWMYHLHEHTQRGKNYNLFFITMINTFWYFCVHENSKKSFENIYLPFFRI